MVLMVRICALAAMVSPCLATETCQQGIQPACTNPGDETNLMQVKNIVSFGRERFKETGIADSEKIHTQPNPAQHTSLGTTLEWLDMNCLDFDGLWRKSGDPVAIMNLAKQHFGGRIDRVPPGTKCDDMTTLIVKRLQSGGGTTSTPLPTTIKPPINSQAYAELKEAGLPEGGERKVTQSGSGKKIDTIIGGTYTPEKIAHIRAGLALIDPFSLPQLELMVRHWHLVAEHSDKNQMTPLNIAAIVSMVLTTGVDIMDVAGLRARGQPNWFYLVLSELIKQPDTFFGTGD